MSYFLDIDGRSGSSGQFHRPGGQQFKRGTVELRKVEKVSPAASFCFGL